MSIARNSFFARIFDILCVDILYIFFLECYMGELSVLMLFLKKNYEMYYKMCQGDKIHENTSLGRSN